MCIFTHTKEKCFEMLKFWSRIWQIDCIYACRFMSISHPCQQQCKDFKDMLPLVSEKKSYFCQARLGLFSIDFGKSVFGQPGLKLFLVDLSMTIFEWRRLGLFFVNLDCGCFWPTSWGSFWLAKIRLIAPTLARVIFGWPRPRQFLANLD